MKKGVIIILAVAIIGGLAAGAGGHHDAASSPSNSGTTAQNPQSVQGATSTNASSGTSYKDGTYTGASEDTPYGTVQVAVVVSGGKITDVNFLQMPSDLGHSQEVTAFSEPYLKQETLSGQSASIQFVSGATTTSEAYEQSLQAALDQAI